MNILIVGGGIAGLSIGWRLAQAGHSIDIFESGRAGRGATWAAAGMLGSAGEIAGTQSPLATLDAQARALWPAFAEELAKLSGIDIGFRRDGALRVASNADEAASLAAHAKDLGEGAAWLSREEARQIAPQLSDGIEGALFFRDEARVDNRALTAALLRGLAQHKATLHELTAVSAILDENNRVTGLATSAGFVRGDAVIVAAGAWSALLGESLPAIRPAKGQMLALSPPEGASLPNPAIWGAGIYLAARRGKLLLGATVEEAGFDTSVSRATQDALLARAVRLVPSLADWPVTESWAGLRPRSPDDAPVLGPTGIEGLFVAAGQFRNGILLAPLIADALRRFVSGTDAGFPVSAFSARRFAVS